MHTKTSKLISIILIIVSLLSVLSGCNKANSDYELKTHNDQSYIVIDNFHNSEYKKEYSGEFHKRTISGMDETNIVNPNMFALNTATIMDYEQYSTFFENHKLIKKYDDTEKNYIVLCTAVDYQTDIDLYINNITFDSNVANVTLRDEITIKEYNTVPKGGDFTISYVVVPVEKEITELNTTLIVTKKEFKELSQINISVFEPEVEKKPILYLYPTEKTNVQVTFPYAKNLICSYPKYTNKWEVIAQPNGDLKDTTTGRDLYALYYEAIPLSQPKVTDEGFVIEGEDSAKFLEEKLEILGLNPREAEEFIIYWLPILESNEYNYIRFETTEEVNCLMPMEINPTPDTLIRILMVFKKLDKPISVSEQTLISPARTGFVAVEWGGLEIQ